MKPLTILFWCITCGVVGWLFDPIATTTLVGVLTGLIIGSGFIFFGKLVNNRLARNLTPIMLLSGLVGGVVTYVLIAPILGAQVNALLPNDGQGGSGIIGIPILAITYGIGAAGVIAGAIASSLLGLIATATLSICIYIWQAVRG